MDFAHKMSWIRFWPPVQLKVSPKRGRGRLHFWSVGELLTNGVDNARLDASVSSCWYWMKLINLAPLIWFTRILLFSPNPCRIVLGQQLPFCKREVDRRIFLHEYFIDAKHSHRVNRNTNLSTSSEITEQWSLYSKKLSNLLRICRYQALAEEKKITRPPEDV